MNSIDSTILLDAKILFLLHGSISKSFDALRRSAAGYSLVANKGAQGIGIYRHYSIFSQKF